MSPTKKWVIQWNFPSTFFNLVPRPQTTNFSLSIAFRLSWTRRKSIFCVCLDVIFGLMIVGNARWSRNPRLIHSSSWSGKLLNCIFFPFQVTVGASKINKFSGAITQVVNFHYRYFNQPFDLLILTINFISRFFASFQGSWVGGIMPLAGLAGGIAGGPFIEYLGRKNTILFTAVPFIISWLLIACANSVWMVLSGKWTLTSWPSLQVN